MSRNVLSGVVLEKWKCEADRRHGMAWWRFPCPPSAKPLAVLESPRCTANEPTDTLSNVKTRVKDPVSTTLGAFPFLVDGIDGSKWHIRGHRGLGVS